MIKSSKVNFMNNYLEYYYKKYPNSEIADYIKFVYQATFGTLHKFNNPTESLSNLKAEISASKSIYFHEDLYDYLRVNLRVYKKYNLNINLLNEIYLNTTNLFVDNGKVFLDEIKKLSSFLSSKGVDISEIDSYLDKAEESGFPDPQHSHMYKTAYQPSYRIIHKRYLSEELEYYQLKNYIESFSNNKINFFAFEDEKTNPSLSLISLLKKEFPITIINTQHFLDIEVTGEQVNSLRIIKEIINPAVVGKNLKYRKYDTFSKSYSEVSIDMIHPIVFFSGLKLSSNDLDEYLNGIIYITDKLKKQKQSIIRKILTKEQITNLNKSLFLKADIII